jgi:hypothetical protein
MVVIYNDGAGDLFCLDCGQPTAEAPVVTFQPGAPPEQQRREVIAKDFGRFLLELVRAETRAR